MTPDPRQAPSRPRPVGAAATAAPTLVIALALALAFAAPVPADAAHPFHVTIMEAEYNPEARSLEIALRVNPVDLAEALSRRAERRVDLDEPDVETLVRRYAADTLELRDNRDRPVPFQWVGMELDPRAGWLYLEFPLPDGPEGVRFANRVFLELEADQVNTVNLRVGDRLRTIRFRREEPWASLARRAPETPPPGHSPSLPRPARGDSGGIALPPPPRSGSIG